MLASVNALAHRSACRINGSPANDLHAGASGAAREALSPHSAAEKTTLAAFTPTEARRAVFVQRAELGTHAGASECPDLPLRHEVAPCEGTRGLEGRLCRSRSSGRVLMPGPALSCAAGNGGVRSTGKAQGSAVPSGGSQARGRPDG